MDKKTVFVKTSTGESEVSGRSDTLYDDAKRILHLVDDESNVGEITKRAPPSLHETINDVLQELVGGGYIRDMRAPDNVAQKPALKMASPGFKMATPKAAPPAASPPASDKGSPKITPPPAMMPDMSKPDLKGEEVGKADKKTDLDFSFISSGASQGSSQADSAQGKSQTEAVAKSRQEAGRAKTGQSPQFEGASTTSKVRAFEGAKVKAQIEVAARARIEAAAREKNEAAAREKLEVAARARSEVAASAKIEAAVREKQEADVARMKAEQVALHARAESEVAKARIEAEVRARIEAEARGKQEAEAIRLKAEREADKLRKELETAKVKAEVEMRNRIEAESRAKAEVEARIKREAEAERLRLEKERAELEVARVRLDAEIRIRAEAEARVQAEVEARLKAEEFAKQVDQAEKLKQSFVESFGQNKKNQGDITGSFKLEKFSMVDTEKIPAYFEPAAKPVALPSSGSKVKAAIEERAGKEAEAKRLMAEQEQAQARGVQNEAARIKTLQDEAAARVKAEQEAYRLKFAQEEERVKAEAEAQKLTDSQARQWEEAQRRAVIQAQAEKDRLAKQEAEAQIKSRQKSNRAPRKSLPVGRIFASLFVLALLAVAGLPYVWPVAEYIAPLEAEISAQIKQPVHIRKIQFALLPLPRLELHTVAIGKAEELKIGDVTMNFDFSALFAPTKSINKLELKNVTVSGESLDKVLLWLQAAGGIEAYPVAQIEFKGVRISGDEVKIPLLNGKADFSTQGKFTHASLKSEDSKWGLELQLEQNNLLLEFNLRDSGLPVFPGVKFNAVSSKVVFTNGEAVFTDFFAHIHGGTLTGKGRLSWNNGWKLQGQVNAKSLELQRMFPSSVLSGEVFGEMNISMASPSFSQMDKDYRLEGSFEAKNGVISKLDIETITRFGARPGVAGRTNFTELSGTIKGGNSGQKIYLGKLATVAANGTGLIDVDANQQLSGKLQVDILRLGMTGVPLRLSGTTTEPILQAGR